MGNHQTLTNHSGIVSVHALQLVNQPGERVVWSDGASQESSPAARWLLGWVTHHGVGGQAEAGNSHTVIARLLWSVNSAEVEDRECGSLLCVRSNCTSHTDEADCRLWSGCCLQIVTVSHSQS